MDVLSAIKLAGVPQISGPSTDTPATGPLPAIPTYDLQKLNSDNPTQAVAAPSAAGSFQNVLTSLVSEVNDQQTAANDAVSGLLSGKNVSLHQTMISMEEASVSFQM